jgi:hypothetical protein
MKISCMCNFKYLRRKYEKENIQKGKRQRKRVREEEILGYRGSRKKYHLRGCGGGVWFSDGPILYPSGNNKTQQGL